MSRDQRWPLPSLNHENETWREREGEREREMEGERDGGREGGGRMEGKEREREGEIRCVIQLGWIYLYRLIRGSRTWLLE